MRRGDVRDFRAAPHRAGRALGPRWFDLIVSAPGRRRRRGPAAGHGGRLLRSCACLPTAPPSLAADPCWSGFGFDCQRAESRVRAKPGTCAWMRWRRNREFSASRGTFHEPLAAQVRTRHLQHRRSARGCPSKTTAWDGVRNYQARNMLRDSMKKGDIAFFYHSSCEVPGIAGIVRIVKRRLSGSRPPSTRKHHHYDPDSKPDAPRWYVVDVKLDAQVQAHHHARRAAAACGRGAEGVSFPAPWESSVGDAGDEAEWDFILTLE